MIDYWLTCLDLLGVVTFAVTGALAAMRRRMDVFGVVVVATVTALGGGTLRDLLLGNSPVFWVEQVEYLLLAAIVGGLTCVVARWFEQRGLALLVFDAIGLATFTVIGVTVAAGAGASPVAAAVMGMITGVVGGVIRDVLCNEVPLILRSEIYAIASLIGAGAFILATKLGATEVWAVPGAMLVTLIIRLIAIVGGLSLPVVHRRDQDR
jgi:uncharacterized membrane protein YeiH